MIEEINSSNEIDISFEKKRRRSKKQNKTINQIKNKQTNEDKQLFKVTKLFR